MTSDGIWDRTFGFVSHADEPSAASPKVSPVPEKQAAQFLDPTASLAPERKVSRRELLRLIRQSIAAEEEAAHLYEWIADAADDPLAKKVMQSVADEEKVHVGEFQKLLDRLGADEQFVEEGEEEVEEEVEEMIGGESEDQPEED